MPEPTYRIAKRLHERRAAVGLPKYGRHLDANSQGCMLVHALEEAADQVNYLLAEIQRRRAALSKIYAVIANLQRWHNSNLNREAETLMAVAESFGGESALSQYDEILGGGTVANSATVDPRDEALRVAEKAMADELDRMKYDKKHRSHKDYAEVSVDELDERMGFMASALAAIRAAGGAR